MNARTLSNHAFALAACCLAAWLPLPVLAQEDTGGPDPWIDRMVEALRPSDSMRATIAAWTKDESGSERKFEIEVLRHSEPGHLTAIVEMREKRTPAPAVLKIESWSGGEVVSWSWDVRFGRFVRMAGLKGTEVFAGTHFRFEDLGFTDLRGRRGGAIHELRDEGRALVEVESGPYFYYGRVVTRIDRDSGLPVSAVIYDQTRARIRELHYGAVRDISGFAVPTLLQYRDEMTRAESRLHFREVELGFPVSVEDFDLEVLERRMKAGEDPVRRPGDTARATAGDESG
jgi:hypothetical protein